MMLRRGKERGVIGMRIILLHSALLVLHAADLLTTSMVPPIQEANPIMRTLWIHGGFGTMVLAKCIMWVFMLAYNLALLKWLPPIYAKAVWVSQFVGFAAMVTLVMWNILIVF